MPASGPLDSSRLASIIIPCCNQIDHTRRCLASLARFTRPPWELILIDNGSTDGTADYFREVQDTAGLPVKILTNPDNRGFPAACNQGLAIARGQYLVLLNNDTVVTDAWLTQLIALADSDPRIGMAGPMSNYASPPQLVPEVPYGNLIAMHRFASDWRTEHRGRWSTTAKLSGFCVLMKRRAFEAIGGLDEQFGLGLFDDDDLAMRMRQAGYELVVAWDLFVHHTGSRTFVGEGINTSTLFNENLARFEAKWGPGVSGGRQVELTSWEATASTEAARPLVVPTQPSSELAVALAIPADLPAGFVVPKLRPGSSREMVSQSLVILAELPGSAAQKATLWERLAAQVVEHGRRNGSTWGMERLRGADGSVLYMGRASEFLVVAPSGTLFRGKGAGCLAGSRGGVLVPHYPSLKPV